MKSLVAIGLRVLGVALIAYVLYRIQYVDILDPDGQAVRGRLVLGEGDEGARFEADDRPGEPVTLSASWRERGDVRPGLFTIIRHSRKLLLGFCFFLFGPLTLISIVRWWFLLRKVGVPTSFADSFRLSFIGFFFNSAVPGLTGGDLVKGFYIARQAKGARVKAFMSVLVDRLIGLFALGLLSAGVLLPRLGDERFRVAALIVFLFNGGCVVFGSLFLSRRLRRLVRLEALLARLPFAHFLQEVDRALHIYREHARAVVVAIVFSVANHVTIVLLAVGMARALGMALPIYQFFILVPVCSMMASIPALPGGWGVREGAFAFFFGLVGVPGTQSVTLSILIGLSQLFWSLLGGYYFLARPDRVTKQDLKTFAAEIGVEATAVRGEGLSG